jgi:peptidoglycan/xylan/chitin deacetylase (PgdA/CDA1 family)
VAVRDQGFSQISFDPDRLRRRRQQRRQQQIRRRRLAALGVLMGALVLIGGVLAIALPFGSDPSADQPSASSGGGKGGGEAQPKPTWKTVGCIPAGAGPFKHGLRRRNGRPNKQFAIGFDDGPSDFTPEVLDILDRYKAKATFYVLGIQVEGRGDKLRAIYRKGHELANHSLNHVNLAGAAGSTVFNELGVTNKRVEAATGFRPCNFRPPYGAVDSTLVAEAKKMGMATVTWDVDSNDWQYGNAEPVGGGQQIAAEVAKNIRPGSIIVMHDGGGNRSATVRALPILLSKMQKRGYKAVTVADLLGFKPKRVKVEN